MHCCVKFYCLKLDNNFLHRCTNLICMEYSPTLLILTAEVRPFQNEPLDHAKYKAVFPNISLAFKGDNRIQEKIYHANSFSILRCLKYLQTIEKPLKLPLKGNKSKYDQYLSLKIQNNKKDLFKKMLYFCRLENFQQSIVNSFKLYFCFTIILIFIFNSDMFLNFQFSISKLTRFQSNIFTITLSFKILNKINLFCGPF